MKEAYQLLREVTNNGILTGEFDAITSWDVMATGLGTAVDYFSSKFNAVKRCDKTDLTSAGCKQSNTNWAAASDAHNARWILPSGVKIQAGWYHGCGFWRGCGISIILWTIIADANSTNSGSWDSSPTVLRLSCDVVGADYTGTDGSALKRNSCNPLLNPEDNNVMNNLLK